MKIFVIARGYPSKQEPTWGCFEKDQAEALSQLGHQVVILSVDTRFRFYWRKIGVNIVEKGGIRAYNMFLIPYALLFFLPAGIKDRLFAWQMDRIYQRAVAIHGTPDILYSHYLRCTQMAVHLRNKYHIPLVGIEHWSALNIRPIPNNIRCMVNKTYPQVDQLLAVSEPLKRNIEEFNAPLKRRIQVVHNMVGKEFDYTPKTNHTSSLKIVSTGRLVYGKGFDLLIDALYNIKDQLPEHWQAIIIGGGKQKECLQQQINAYSLQAHILLAGPKNKAQIVQMLQESDMFVFPSRGENFSVAVLEALACGLPVVASICGGIRECIHEKNGLLFPVDDVDALSAAILQMANNKSHYDRQAITDDCQAHFAPQVIAQQLTTIFENTIKATKSVQ